MARGHPVHQYDKRFATDTNRNRDFLNKLMSETRDDINARSSWVDQRAYYQRRRYCQEWRNPSSPWVGSSNIVLPLIDKTHDELKPAFANLILGARPPIAAIGFDAESQRNANNVENFFDWLIHYVSDNFDEELLLGIDDLLEIGRCIFHPFWKYETRTIPEVILPEKLPPRLRSLIVVGTEEEADEVSAELQSRGIRASVLGHDSFDANREMISQVVQEEFDLDPDERRDQRAIDSILDWFRSGAEEPLKFVKKSVVRSAPTMEAISPIDFIVPDKTGTLMDAERMTRVVYLNEFEVRQRVMDSGWDSEVADMLLEGKGDGRRGDRVSWNYHEDNADREGIYHRSKGHYEIWVTSTYMSPAKNQPDQKVFVIWSPRHPQKPLRAFVYGQKDWPYRTATLEVNKKRWHSARGIPELLDDLDNLVTFEHRQKLNRMHIANAPTFKYRQTAGIVPENMQWIPGQFFPVDSMDDVAPFEVPNPQVSEEREEQVLRTWAEDRIGSTDFGLAGENSLIEPRTATEIRGIQQKARNILSLRGIPFKKCMNQVFQDFFDLWHQFGDNRVWVRVTGGDEPILLTKEEIQGRFSLQVVGQIGELDPVFEAQKALARIQALLQIQQTGAAEPHYELNIAEAIADWVAKDDHRLAKRILRRRSEEEVQQIMQQRQQQQELVQRAKTNQALTPDELEVALQELKKDAPHKGAQNVTMVR